MRALPATSPASRGHVAQRSHRPVVMRASAHGDRPSSACRLVATSQLPRGRLSRLGSAMAKACFCPDEGARPLARRSDRAPELRRGPQGPPGGQDLCRAGPQRASFPRRGEPRARGSRQRDGQRRGWCGAGRSDNILHYQPVGPVAKWQTRWI
ncbi:uncharacterized protein SOCEGT47_055690 [Sorangium cellulosum]|uniref:Uncharacterized protein n=1 Tax=Sorangium cellulosum TaxID=56 RepID=A0A4P2Q6C3_SORCE|nr:uncharacterized protein SOCEGT47_055690 [Sorangium cellulosum]